MHSEPPGKWRAVDSGAKHAGGGVAQEDMAPLRFSTPFDAKRGARAGEAQKKKEKEFLHCL